MIIGVVGLAFIVAAWALSIKDPPPLRLSILYSLGSLLLTLHAYLISDLIFTLLNMAALALSVVNIFRRLRLGSG